MTLNSFFTTPLRQPNLGVDITTFTPIAMMGVDPFVLWVHKDSGITTFEQWVEDGEEPRRQVRHGRHRHRPGGLARHRLSRARLRPQDQVHPLHGGGAVAKELAGQQIMATVNNPSEARGFYQSGDVVPLVAFSDERLPAFPDVPTMKELGHDFSYYNQRAVVGAPGQSAEAAAYYQDLFKTIYETARVAGLHEVRKPVAAVDDPGRAEGLLEGAARPPQEAARGDRQLRPSARP